MRLWVTLCLITTLQLLPNRILAATEAEATTTSLPTITAADLANRQLLVKFREGSGKILWSQLLQPYSFTSMQVLYSPTKYLQSFSQQLSPWQLITFDSVTAAGDSFDALRNNPDVEYVAPNWKFDFQSLPNDLVPEQWGLRNEGQDGGAAGSDIDAELGWSIRSSAKDVVVAVIDSGIDYSHPDLAANMWTNPGEIPGNNIDDDGNGFVDDVHGYDFADKDSDPMDVNSHGTHVAGIIGAVGDNNTGITGVAWEAKLMAIKIFGDEANVAYTSDIVQGILYAADMGARISNNSYGATFTDSVAENIFNRPIADAIDYANKAGMLFIAAAGNNGVNSDKSLQVTSPATIDHPNVISVAANTRSDRRASFSNHGETGADISAPGADILSTVPGGGYDSYSGTSMAAPFVTGAAALVAAEFPDVSVEELRAVLIGSAEPVANLTGVTLNGGRLNLHRALTHIPSGDCPNFSATPMNHYLNGRADYCAGTYINFCARGSNEYIGTNYQTQQVVLFNSEPDFYSTTNNCPPANTPPSLVSDDPQQVHLRVGGSAPQPLLSATDNQDGDISAAVGASGIPDTQEAGHYLRRFTVADSGKLNAVPWVQKITVVANDEPPRLALLGPACNFWWCDALLHPAGQPWQDPGYVGWDILDGDLTDSVTYTPVDTNTLGIQAIYYSVADSAGNEIQSSAFRLVGILGPEEPAIEFEAKPNGKSLHNSTTAERLRIRTYRRDDWTFNPSAYVLDMADGFQYLPQESFTHNVDPSRDGDYLVTATFTDSDGNTVVAEQRVEIVTDTEAPTLSLIGSSTMEIEIGDDFADPGYQVNDNLDPYSWVTRSGDPDTNTEGAYVKTYQAIDGSDNASPILQRTINVVRSHWNHAPRSSRFGWSRYEPNKVRIEATFFDIDDDIAGIEVEYNRGGKLQPENGIAFDPDNHTFSASFTLTGTPGDYTFFAIARDANGNEATSTDFSASLFPASEPPVIDTLELAVAGYEVRVLGNTSDPDEDISEIRITSELDFTCTGTGAFECVAIAPEAGSYEIKVQAIDEAGNASELQVLSAQIAMACETATNTAHINAGRAVECGTLFTSSACAVGSGDALGSSSL
ncbi:S8 family serine peptidase [uncultured Microbulbifer sp.]|uniref:S8 family serine peptidase n=1 Tax=uncultured Microbulbifer sp. TaxID=348147 RepID=UPI0025F8CD01|nr:S8 family serine peptidase [uncultured Microbulbifer sp.]